MQHLQRTYLKNRKGISVLECLIYMVCISLIIVMYTTVFTKIGVDESYKDDIVVLQNYRNLLQDISYAESYVISNSGLELHLLPQDITYKFEDRVLKYKDTTTTYEVTRVSYGDFKEKANGLIEVNIVTKESTHNLTISTKVNKKEEGVEESEW